MGGHIAPEEYNEKATLLGFSSPSMTSNEPDQSSTRHRNNNSKEKE